jgi:hypothetical protein
VTVLEAGVMFSVADVAFYNVSGAQRFVDDSLSYSTRVLSFVGGPCSFPDETLDEDNYFLMCAMHHGYQVQTLPSTLAVNVKVCVCSVCGCVRVRVGGGVGVGVRVGVSVDVSMAASPSTRLALKPAWARICAPRTRVSVALCD